MGCQGGACDLALDLGGEGEEVWELRDLLGAFSASAFS